MKKYFFLPILVLFFSIGCSTLQNLSDAAFNYQIAFPPDVDQSSFTKYTAPEVPFTTDIVNSATFGTYSIQVVRSAMEKTEDKSGWFFKSKRNVTASEKYTYVLKGIGDETWKGECSSYAHDRYKQSGVLMFKKEEYDFKSYLQTTAVSGKGHPIEIHLEAVMGTADKIPPVMKGYAQRGKIRIDLERTMNTEKVQLFPMHIGYYIYYKGKLVAVVQNLTKGIVYISSSLDKDLLPLVINVSAVLLTYYDLELVVLPDDEEE